MATETTPTVTQTCTEPERGFGLLPCPRCGEDTHIRLDLDDCAVFTCTSCEADFAADDVRNLVAVWSDVLARIDRMFA